MDYLVIAISYILHSCSPGSVAHHLYHPLYTRSRISSSFIYAIFIFPAILRTLYSLSCSSYPISIFRTHSSHPMILHYPNPPLSRSRVSSRLGVEGFSRRDLKQAAPELRPRRCCATPFDSGGLFWGSIQYIGGNRTVRTRHETSASPSCRRE